MSKNQKQTEKIHHEPGLAVLLRWVVYLIAFVPLIIFSNYISPFHFGKVVVFRSIIELALVFYLLLLWQDRSYFPKPNRILWSVLAFAGAFTLTTATSVLPFASFWGSLERMGGLWTFWHYIVFFIIMTSVLRTREHWYRLLELSVFVGILSALYGFAQKLPACPPENPECFSSNIVGAGNRERIFGTIGNAALFAGYEIVNFFLALTLFFRRDNGTGRKVFFGAAAALSGLAIIMTVVRGSLMGMGIGLFLFSAFFFIAYRSRIAKLLFLVLTASAGIFFLSLIVPSMKNVSIIKESRFLSRLTDTSFDTYTAKTRFWAWEAGFTGWQENTKTMVLGWGPENFNVPFSKNFNPKFFTGPGAETLFDRAHNMFVEILVTMGLLGFLAYVGMFWFAFSVLYSIGKHSPRDRLFAVGLVPLFVAYIIHNSFIFDTSANFIIFFTVLGFVSFLHSSNDHDEKTEHRTRKRTDPAAVGFVGLLLLIPIIVLIFRTNVMQSRANYTTTRGIVAGWQGKFDDAVAKFKESIDYSIPGKYEYRHRAAQYIMEQSNNKNLGEFPNMRDAILWIIPEVQKNADENPVDYLPELYLSRLNIILGKSSSDSPYNDEALMHALKALDIAPKFVRTYFEIGQVYLNKKDFEKAAEYFGRAVELNPETPISHWYYGITLAEMGNNEDALRELEFARKNGHPLSLNDFKRLANTYLKAGNPGGAITVIEELAQSNENNADFWAAAADVYRVSGLIDRAIAAAHRVAEIDPSIEAEARAFVEAMGGIW